MFDSFNSMLFSQLICSIALQSILVGAYISVKYKLAGLRSFSRTISAHLLGLFAVGFIFPLIVGGFLWFLSPAAIPGAVALMLFLVGTCGFPSAVGDILVIPRLQQLTLTTVDGMCLVFLNYAAACTTNIVFQNINRV